MKSLIELMPAVPTGDVERLYVESFPEAERRPLEAWRCALRPGGKARLVEARAVQSGRMVGFATVWHLRNALYVEHLATLAEVRGRGVGGEMIEKLKAAASYAGLPLVLEAEPAVSGEMAARRLAFYGRHGLEPVEGIGYVQPPYAEGLPEVEMELLSSRPLTEEEAEKIVKEIKALVYGLMTNGLRCERLR